MSSMIDTIAPSLAYLHYYLCTPEYKTEFDAYRRALGQYRIKVAANNPNEKASNAVSENVSGLTLCRGAFEDLTPDLLGSFLKLELMELGVALRDAVGEDNLERYKHNVLIEYILTCPELINIPFKAVYHFKGRHLDHVAVFPAVNATSDKLLVKLAKRVFKDNSIVKNIVQSRNY